MVTVHPEALVARCAVFARRSLLRHPGRALTSAGLAALVVALAARPAQAQPAPAPAPLDAAPASAPEASPPPGDPGSPGAPDAPPSARAPDTWGRSDAATPDAEGTAPPGEVAGAPPRSEAPSAPLPAPLEPDEGPLGSEPMDEPPLHGGRGAPPRRRAADARIRYALEAIEIHGNQQTHARVILRYVPFEPGDLIDVADPSVELTRFRLLGTGFFSDVQFSLRRGSERGQVVLVIEVVERNTIILNGAWLGLSTDRDEQGRKRPLTSFGGLDVAETNLGGTGISLGAAAGLAQDQLALRLRFLDPVIADSDLLVSAELLYNDALDFFGNAAVSYLTPDQQAPRDYAVLPYQRFGGSVGVGWDLSVATQLWFHYHLEAVEAEVPVAAAHTRNGYQPIEPIDFDVQPGDSILSAVRATLAHDTRDQPFLPQRGWLARCSGEFALGPLGSDYAYQKVELQASRWWRLPWRHVVRLELFGGAITGPAPFFEQYYVADFSDFLASRVLGLSLDRRPPSNFLGTAIAEARRGHYAARVGGEYRVPLYVGHRSVYGIDAFLSAGLYALASQHDLDDPSSLYRGAARFPVDLTGNLGLRMDTSAGGLTFAFSNVLGFIPAW
ncbi:MAG TPA: BamA/TamA family outer membrane protein [Polyangiaceae bacterium]|nr:BamA/TamA family outer membrane protein [Polyangiaceae bacterium]